MQIPGLASLFRARKRERKTAGDCEGGEGMVRTPFGKCLTSPPFMWNSLQGARPYNEDVACGHCDLDREQAFFGCFDGHAGKRAALWAKENLPENVFRHLKRHSPADALIIAFADTNADFLKHAWLGDWNDGCTATTALLLGTDLYVANAGDSRAVLCRRGDAPGMPLSVDHKPSVPSEAARIKARGGTVVTPARGCARINGSLATSRGFGDKSFTKYITAEPDIRHRKLEAGDDFLILATDGLWDVLSNEQAATIVLTSPTVAAAARALTAEAWRLGSLDNITALVIDLRPLLQPGLGDSSFRQPDALSSASTEVDGPPLGSSVTARNGEPDGDETPTLSAPESAESVRRHKVRQQLEALQSQITQLEKSQQFFEDEDRIRVLKSRVAKLRQMAHSNDELGFKLSHRV